MRAEGQAVESIWRVLREQGCQIAARTYRAWARPTQQVAARTVSDALVLDKVRQLAWTVDHEGARRLTPEGVRRKLGDPPSSRRLAPEPRLTTNAGPTRDPDPASSHGRSCRDPQGV